MYVYAAIYVGIEIICSSQSYNLLHALRTFTARNPARPSTAQHLLPHASRIKKPLYPVSNRVCCYRYFSTPPFSLTAAPNRALTLPLSRAPKRQIIHLPQQPYPFRQRQAPHQSFEFCKFRGHYDRLRVVESSRFGDGKGRVRLGV